MKIIGNRHGEFLVADDVDETSDDYQCEPIATDVEVTGDPNGICTVTFERPIMASYGRHAGVARYRGSFVGGALRGQWVRID